MPEPSSDVVHVLVENHRRFLAFLERRLGNSADAEDILQSAFFTSVEKGQTVRGNETVIAWFYRVLRNALIDHYRHRDAEHRALNRVPSSPFQGEDPEPDVERAICECVLDVLSTLRHEHATVLRRVDLEDAPIAVVAAETGMTPNNVRVRLHRARAALRSQLRLCCGSCAEHGCLDCSCRRRTRS